MTKHTTTTITCDASDTDIPREDWHATLDVTVLYSHDLELPTPTTAETVHLAPDQHMLAYERIDNDFTAYLTPDRRVGLVVEEKWPGDVNHDPARTDDEAIQGLAVTLEQEVLDDGE